MKNVQGIIDKELNWEKFEKLRREHYLSECYYNDKVKAFYELIMGKMMDDEYITNFLEFLWYIPYLRDEKKKIKIFLSCLPIVFRDKIEMLELHSLSDAVKKLKHYFEQARHRPKAKGIWRRLEGVDKARNWPKKHAEKKENK